MRKRIFGLFLMIGWAFSGCATEPGTVYDSYKELKDMRWVANDSPKFDFDIEDVNRPYDIFLNVRNDMDYPFRNLYVSYALTDAKGDTLSSELKNIMLFEPKTGYPYGTGMGSVKDLREALVKSVKFSAPGPYSISLRQMMRKDTLDGISAVGIRVSVVKPQAEK
ncbi:gliding motility lipoprotein GldH [Fulvitalea axinellae]|uniref:Gliding motility lipoprotein GldH n=1 Tax=Fulvitalea axinellae TaxID=1182444 RepID=A0AAU9CYE8_9BACT|nr:gliding motility lipoprotein GldH [Fulvitalea axinellae]